MSIIKKLVFFNDGTASVGEDARPDNLLGKLYKYFICDPNNLVWDMYKHCEERCYYFPGPATEICYSHQNNFHTKLLHTLAGAIYGNLGAHGIDNTIAKIKAILLEEMQTYQQESPKEKVELEVHLIGWSRGGFLNWALKKELARWVADGSINLKSINLIYIDPVVGGPFDRFKLSQHSTSKDPDTEINSSIYYSHTGNLHHWYLNFNMPFFSALDPVDDKTKENSEAFMLDANHEEVAGKRGADAGKLIRAHIISKTTLKFRAEWMDKVQKEGKEAAIKESSKGNKKLISTRAHLHPSPGSCFFGNPKKHPWLTSLSSSSKATNDQQFEKKQTQETEKENIHTPSYS